MSLTSDRSPATRRSFDAERGPPRGLARPPEWLALSVMYLLTVVLLYADRVREFGDESDNLLGGLLLARGARLYVDFFSSHMPLPYYVAALAAELGASSLADFRLYSDGLLVLTTAAIAWSFRTVPGWRVMLLWAIATVFAHRLQFGEMLTASTVAAYGIFVAGLLCFSVAEVRFTIRHKLALSAVAFVALESELVAVFPLALLGLAYVVKRVRRAAAADVVVTGIVILAPHLVLVAALASQRQLNAFVDQAFTYNQVYYSQFVMNPSIVGMLHDWEAQYRTYLLQSLGLGGPLGVHTVLVLANIGAAILVGRRRGPVWGAGLYLFVGLCHVRNEGAYYLASYFSLALLVDAAAHARGRWPTLLARAAAGVLAVTFVILVERTYDFTRLPPRYAPEVRAIAAITSQDDRIFVVPFDPYVYLAAARRPASMYTYYLPWHVIAPAIVSRLHDDLRANRPAVVVFRGDEPVNDRYYARDYASDLYRFLLSEGYAPLGEQDLFGDVLVRADRLVNAQQRIATDVDLRSAAEHERATWARSLAAP